MDESRRIRLIIPPFFLILSIGVGLYFSDFDFYNILNPKMLSIQALFVFEAVIGAVILPVGFLITSISILILTGFSWALCHRTYEAVLVPETRRVISSLIKTKIGNQNEWELYTVATFDHETLSPGIHEWVVRRWSAFNISVHSCTAVVIAHISVAHQAIYETWEWVGLTFVLVLILGTTAWLAWLQTMRMLEFQATRDASIFDNRAKNGGS